MNLEKYRRILMAREHELLRDLNRAALSDRENPEAGESDLVDASVLSERKESRFAQADRDTKLLNEIQDALRRIADGTYGRCLEDGRQISEARLEAVPWARCCVEHQRLHHTIGEGEQLTL